MAEQQRHVSWQIRAYGMAGIELMRPSQSDWNLISPGPTDGGREGHFRI